MTSAETIALFQQYVIPNYTRYPVCLVRGEGSWLIDEHGDFVGGDMTTLGLAMLWVGRRTPGNWRDLLVPWTVCYAFMRVIINGCTAAAIGRRCPW